MAIALIVLIVLQTGLTVHSSSEVGWKCCKDPSSDLEHGVLLGRRHQVQGLGEVELGGELLAAGASWLNMAMCVAVLLCSCCWLYLLLASFVLQSVEFENLRKDLPKPVDGVKVICYNPNYKGARGGTPLERSLV